MMYSATKFRWFLIIASMLLLVACGATMSEGDQKETESADNDSGDAITLKLGHVFAENDITHKSSEKLAELAEEYSDGEIIVDVYSNSQLGEEKDLVEGVDLGTIDIALSSNAVVTNFIPSLVYWDLPYLIDSTDHIDRIVDSEVGELLDQTFESNNFKNLGVQYGGFRQITNSLNPIEKIEDFDGINLRVLESEVMLDTFNNLPGVKTQNMAFSELYSGLQQGVVNAQENPINLIYSMKFQEVQDYLSITNHFYTTRYFLMNFDKYDSLSKKQQDALTKATEEAMEYHKQELFDDEESILEELKEEGMEINEVSNDFIEDFRSIMEEKVYTDYYEKIGDGDEEKGKEIIEKIANLR